MSGHAACGTTGTLHTVSPLDFISFWRAQPFRPFRIHTPRGTFEISQPLQVAMSPGLQRIAILPDDARTESFSPDEITACEWLDPSPQPTPPRPDTASTPASIAAMIAEAQAAAASWQPDPGKLSLLSASAKDGVHLVHVGISDAAGRPIFSTAGTRWNLHGVESFENGRTLFLHHLDHPSAEQRIIIWPPNSGTFESFAEAMPLNALVGDLHDRDAKLASQPEPPFEPPPSHLRDIVFQPRTFARRVVYDRDGDTLPIGAERFKLELVQVSVGRHDAANEPLITDALTNEVLLDLRGTTWDADVTTDGTKWSVDLRRWPDGGRSLTAWLDLVNHTASVGPRSAPIEWFERQIRNFHLYEEWDTLRAVLEAGPQPAGRPEFTLPFAGDYGAELWPGEHRHPLPFLQPRIVDPRGNALFDTRASQWAAFTYPFPDRPMVLLRFVSADREDRFDAARHWVYLDLISHRVTVRYLEGSTTLGQLQAMIHRVRGTKWMNEAMPELIAKGRGIPLPQTASAG